MNSPNWQPIEALPLIAGMLDGQLHDVRQPVANLEKCRNRPGVLDDYSVSRLLEVFGEQRDFVPIYREQLARWQQLPLDDETRLEINRLNAVIDQWTVALDSVLYLAKTLPHS